MSYAIRKTGTDLYYNFNYSSFTLLGPGCLLPEETMTAQHADLLSEHVQIESFLQSPLTGFVLQQDSGLFWDFHRDRPGVFTSSCLLPDQQIAEAWRI